MGSVWQAIEKAWAQTLGRIDPNILAIGSLVAVAVVSGVLLYKKSSKRDRR